MPAVITVLVADAQRMFAEALSGYLERYGDLRCLQELPLNAQEAVQLAFWKRPDVVLLDYWMSDMEGPAAAAAIVNKRPDTKVILLSWFHGQKEIEKAFASGAAGFIPKCAGLEDLVAAIRQAHSGRIPVYGPELEDLMSRLEGRGREVGEFTRILAKLSPRESEILRLLCFGHSNQQIAEKLVLSPATVKDHIHNLVRKTGQAQVRQVVAMARFCGWIRD